jgi:flagellar biosynthesis protein FlhA
MNQLVQRFPFLAGVKLKGLAIPVLIMLMLAMMIMPLPPFLLDVLFTFNIALALIVLLVSVYTVKPLDFAAFPIVLLVTTLMRLSLNVASTRAVLLNGHTGPDAAGKVIEAFGHFVIGGNLAVGLIVFAILVVINFVVVTKGAGRIAEVSARFTLDAMPGKQMAIDADLSAGLIDEATAKKRRTEVANEADFFGSMDGASKFVRGDAIAGIMILFITIIGGLIIGMTQHDLSVGQAANNYVLLAIGDALVAQIPSLVISIAAGLIVSRVGSDEDMGGQLFTQLFSTPRALGLTGGVMILMGVVPGMPHVAFLTLGGACAYAAWWLHKREQQAAAQPAAEAAAAGAAPAAPVNNEASWDDLQPVDTLGLEVGYRLIALVDKNQNGELLARIKGVRKKFAQDVGFLPPAVHIRDNLELRPNAYRITLKGVVVGEGEAFNGLFLAINPGQAVGHLQGTSTIDPAFGLPATWIDAKMRDLAQTQGFTVVDAATVVATHLSHLMQVHAAKLLGRTETQQLIDHINKVAPKLVDDVVPKLISISAFQKVLQLLLDEAVHIRDMRSIVESLAEHATVTQDPLELSRRLRVGLAPAIVQQIYGPAQELNVIAIEPQLENLLVQALGQANGMALEPTVAELMVKATADAAQRQEEAGVPACLLVPDSIRTAVARLVKRAAPRLRVLSHSEIPDTHAIRIGSIIGGNA